MIYYEILSCKTTNPQYAYEYSTVDEKKFEPYLKPSYSYAPSPIYNEYTDSEADQIFFNGLNKWLTGIRVQHETNFIDDYTKVTYPDGSVFYRYNGTNIFGAPKSSYPTTEDLISIYQDGTRTGYVRTRSGDEWAENKSLVTPSIFESIPLIPGPGSVPVFA